MKAQERFDEILVELMSEMNAQHLLTYPGIYEIMSEQLNNAILTKMGYTNDGKSEEE